MNSKLNLYRQKLARLSADYQHACRCVQEEQQQLQQARKHAEAVLQAQQVVQTVAAEVQNRVHQQIAAVVTRCLQTVFGEEYGFQIEFVRKRGKTEANLILTKEDLILDDPVNQCGGGIIDLTSFALRLVALVLSQPKRRKFLCLDEPMKHLSVQFRPAVKELLLVLSREMDIQMLIVTHSPELAVGKVIELGN